MAINGGIFGGFSGGIPSNTLTFNPGLLAGQVVPSSSAFNPTPILQTFFQPFPFAADSLVTSNMIALTGGGPPLIASYPTLSPFSNAFLNLFNPAATQGLGGLTPGVGAANNPIGGAGLTNLSTLPGGNAGGGGLGSLAGLGGLMSLNSLAGLNGLIG